MKNKENSETEYKTFFSRLASWAVSYIITVNKTTHNIQSLMHFLIFAG